MKSLRILRSTLALLALAALFTVTARAATGSITNPTSAGTVWKDTSGNDIINFCGFILKSGSTFYWYGWDKYSHTVNCYTSTTLGSNSWTKVTGNGFPMFGSGFHGRPGVLYNASTSKYVMIVEYSSPSGRNGIQYLTSSAPGGPFTSQQQDPLLLGGISMGDMGVFQDDDGQGYVLVDADDGGNNNGTNKIIRLNSNYIGQSAVVATWTVTSNRTEALAMIKHNGTYILTASKTAGWNSSPTWYKTSSTLAGFASAAWNNTPTSPNSTTSYNTQHDFILKIVGTQTTSYMYAGDRWSQDTGVGFGRNAWYQVTFNGNVPTIVGDDTWTIDPVTGVVNGAPPQTITINPAKDSMVKLAAPTSNFGTQNQLQVSNQTNFQKQAFLQFNITTIPAGATVTNVTLEVVSQSNASGVINAKAVGNTTWSETGITWNTKPAMGITLGTGDSSHTAAVASTWNVTSHVTANGNYTIGLESTISGDTNFHSREATNSGDRPRLKVTYTP